jgi:hypothetical protein
MAQRGFVYALFPASAARVMRPSPRAVAGAVLLVAVVAAVQILRVPQGAAVNTVWAEDGAIFLGAAKWEGAGALLHPYNGYVNLVPRLVAALVATFPLAWAAMLLGIFAALVVGAVTLSVFVASQQHVPSPWWRAALCGWIAFVPIAGQELLGNISNLQWYLMVAAMWALLWRPQGRAGKVAQFAVCFLAAASGPLSVLLLPLAVGRVVATRALGEHAPTAGLLAGLALQVVVNLLNTAGPPGTPQYAGIPLLGRLYLLRVVVVLFVGDHGAKALFSHYGWGVAYVAIAVAVVAAVAWVGPRRRRNAAWLLAALGLTSVLMFAVPVELRWGPLFVPRVGSTEGLSFASRYVFVPLVALASLVACAMGGRWLRPRAQRRLAVFPAVMLAAAATVWVLDFSAVDSPRQSGPLWQPELAAAQSTCRATPGLATASVNIRPPGWAVELHCSDLVASSR